MHIIFLNGLIMVTLMLLTLLLFVSGNKSHPLLSLIYFLYDFTNCFTMINPKIPKKVTAAAK